VAGGDGPTQEAARELDELRALALNDGTSGRATKVSKKSAIEAPTVAPRAAAG
jgi:hypothetical protein